MHVRPSHVFFQQCQVVRNVREQTAELPARTSEAFMSLEFQRLIADTQS
jgi:hypothetical protein